MIEIFAIDTDGQAWQCKQITYIEFLCGYCQKKLITRLDKQCPECAAWLEVRKDGRRDPLRKQDTINPSLPHNAVILHPS